MQGKYHVTIILLLIIVFAFAVLFFSETGKQLRGYREIPGNAAVKPTEQTATGLVNDKLPLVIIDPGHGGEETGAIGWNTGIPEKEITLAIALQAKQRLEHEGVQVLLTRIGDWMLDPRDKKNDLLARARLAEQLGGDLFISIHADQFDRVVRGSKVFYSEQNPCTKSSMRLARLIHDTFVTSTGSRSLGVHMENFIVLRENTVPAVLIETGFVSQKEEEQLLIAPAYQKKAGEAIAEGIISYLNEAGNEKTPVTGCD